MTRRKRDTSSSKSDKPTQPPADDAPELSDDWLVEDGAAAADEPAELDDSWLEDNGLEIELEELSGGPFDLRLLIPLGDMDKAAVLAAVEPALRQQAAASSRQLFGKHLVIKFGGEALVPSAAKELCADVLAPHKPRSITIQRGYSDELCYEGEVPELGFELDIGSERTQLTVDGSGLDAGVAASLFDSRVSDQKASFEGQVLHLRWADEGRPDTADLRAVLAGAGVRKIVLERDGDEEVLFDRDLEEAVQINPAGKGFCIQIQTKGGLEVWGKALRELWPEEGERLGGKRLEVQFEPGRPGADEVAHLLPLAARLKPEQMALAEGELIWPTLLRVARKAGRMLIKMAPTEAHDITSAARREMRLIKVADHELTFDWPAGSKALPEVEKMLLDGQPKSLFYTFGGQDKTLVHPQAVRCQRGGGQLQVEIDTALARPAELLGQIDSALAGAQGEGLPAVITAQGGGVVPRAMREALCTALQAVGVASAVLVEGEERDYLFPDLLHFEPVTGGKIAVSLQDARRPAEDLATSAAAEIQANFGDSSPVVELQPSAQDAPLIQALLESGVRELWLLTSPRLKVFPCLFQGPEQEDGQLRLTAKPEGEEDDIRAQMAHELPHLLQDLGALQDLHICVDWPAAEAQDPLPARLLGELREAGVGTLSFRSGNQPPVQIHPEPVPEVTEAPKATATAAAPVAATPEPPGESEKPAEATAAADDEAAPAVAVLGSRLAAEPPMTMLSLDLAEEQGLETALQTQLENCSGHQLLLVCQVGGRVINPNIRSPRIVSLLSQLSPQSPSLLLFRPAKPAGLGFRGSPAHFEVCHSTLSSLPLASRHQLPGWS